MQDVNAQHVCFFHQCPLSVNLTSPSESDEIKSSLLNQNPKLDYQHKRANLKLRVKVV